MVREENQATAVIASTGTSTHTFEMFQDGIVAIQIRDDTILPDYVEKTKHLPGYMALDRADIEALLTIASQHAS